MPDSRPGAAILLCSMLALSACGLKDDLYLPEPVPAPVSAEPAEDEEADR